MRWPSGHPCRLAHRQKSLPTWQHLGHRAENTDDQRGARPCCGLVQVALSGHFNDGETEDREEGRPLVSPTTSELPLIGTAHMSAPKPHTLRSLLMSFPFYRWEHEGSRKWIPVWNVEKGQKFSGVPKGNPEVFQLNPHHRDQWQLPWRLALGQSLPGRRAPLHVLPRPLARSWTS